MSHAVLICTEDHALARQLQAIAQKAGLEVYQAATAPMALKLMTDHQPALVLLDQPFENGAALDVAGNLQGFNEQVRIVLLVREQQFELGRRALRMGITDLLLLDTELSTLPDLLTRLCHSVETHTHHHEGRVFAFFSPKGGTGRTLLAVNTAVAAVGLHSGRVLLIDGNLQTGDVSAMLDVKSPRSIADLLPVLDELTPGHIQNVCATHQSGLHVLLAPPDPALGHALLPEHLARIVRVARRAFSVIVIDCPSLMDERCTALVEAASTPVLVATADAPFIFAWRRLRQSAAGSLARAKVVVNQATPKAEISHADLAKLLELPAAGEVRLDYAAVMPLVNTGLSLFDTPAGSKRKKQKPSPLAMDVLRLARRLLV